MYQHRDWWGALFDLPASKVVCVGRNYRDHIKEMGTKQTQEPVLFIKPETALCDLHQPLILPTQFGEVHHELELAVLIGHSLKNADEQQVAHAIVAYGMALDLTLRDIQTQLKNDAQPWEKSKGFDGACPVSGFIPASEFGDPQNVALTLRINGEIRQQGHTQDMLTPILPLISTMSRFFTLRAGDIILTGTPAGVGSLHKGDHLMITFNQYKLETDVI